MPLLAAIDEYNSAINKIHTQAVVALESGSKDYMQAALNIIVQQCLDADDAVNGLLGPIDN